MNENTRIVGENEEDAEVRVEWRWMILCGKPLKGTAKR